MKISEVIDEFMREMKQVAALDAMIGHTREEATMWVQTIFLRASVRLFDKSDKAGFASMAKIAWNSVHETPAGQAAARLGLEENDR